MHTLQSRSAENPELTLVSLDAAAAYDVVSRSAMLEEEEEDGTREYPLPYNHVPPPSISGGLRNRHCPPPRGVQVKALVNAAKAQ